MPWVWNAAFKFSQMNLSHDSENKSKSGVDSSQKNKQTNKTKKNAYGVRIFQVHYWLHFHNFQIWCFMFFYINPKLPFGLLACCTESVFYWALAGLCGSLCSVVLTDHRMTLPIHQDLISRCLKRDTRGRARCTWLPGHCWAIQHIRGSPC